MVVKILGTRGLTREAQRVLLRQPLLGAVRVPSARVAETFVSNLADALSQLATLEEIRNTVHARGELLDAMQRFWTKACAPLRRAVQRTQSAQQMAPQPSQGRQVPLPAQVEGRVPPASPHVTGDALVSGASSSTPPASVAPPPPPSYSEVVDAS